MLIENYNDITAANLLQTIRGVHYEMLSRFKMAKSVPSTMRRAVFIPGRTYGSPSNYDKLKSLVQLIKLSLCHHLKKLEKILKGQFF